MLCRETLDAGALAFWRWQRGAAVTGARVWLFRLPSGQLVAAVSLDAGCELRETIDLLVVIHGALRDSGPLSWPRRRCPAGSSGTHALIVAPQFLADVDIAVRAHVPESTLYWDVEGWKGGLPAIGHAAVSSFTAMDSLLLQLTGPEMLPDHRKPVVVIAGNSAGGQFVNRYAAVGRAPETLAERGMPVRFIIANPSSYLYLIRSGR